MFVMSDMRILPTAVEKTRGYRLRNNRRTYWITEVSRRLQWFGYVVWRYDYYIYLKRDEKVAGG